MKRLDEIEARANAATEGPWEVNGPDQPWAIISHGSDSVLHAYEQHHPYCEGCECGDSRSEVALSGEDAEFIAHARTDVPALLDALEKVLRLHPRVVVLHADPEFGRMEDDAICGACIVDYEAADWPCPTVEAITTALEGETND